MGIRIVSSISDVITNSSTEIFIISGPDAFRQIVGSGVYSSKKYRSLFIYLKSDKDVIDFFIEDPGRRINHNFYSRMVRSFVGSEFYDTFFNCLEILEDRQEEIIELFKTKILEKLKGTIIFYNTRNNQKVLERLRSLFPDEGDIIDKGDYRYQWTKD